MRDINRRVPLGRGRLLTAAADKLELSTGEPSLLGSLEAVAITWRRAVANL
jgi:hypothetical protein